MEYLRLREYVLIYDVSGSLRSDFLSRGFLSRDHRDSRRDEHLCCVVEEPDIGYETIKHIFDDVITGNTEDVISFGAGLGKNLESVVLIDFWRGASTERRCGGRHRAPGQ